jgi:site-specific recombinase XerD
METNPEGNRESTMRSHNSRLAHFVQWCTDSAAIDTLNELRGPDLEAFKASQVAAGYAPRTLESQMETVGVFLRFCQRHNYVVSELPYLVPEIDVPTEDETRDRLLERERATAIIDHMATFQYASREHVVWLLLAEKGLRICTLVALDCEDYQPPTDEDDGYLDVGHRPATDTRLKNGEKSERQLALSPAVCDTLDDYIAYNRTDATDDHGRAPLLSTANGRVAESTIRTYINKWTAPCAIDGECPHGRDPDECTAAHQAGNMDCPSKRSPHDVRRGYITYLRRRGVPKEIISDEVDASVAVLDHHYDKTTKAEQRQMRAAALKAVIDASEE